MIVREIVTCPECGSTKVDAEPGYKDGECVGTRWICRDCGVSELYEEESVEESESSREDMEKEWVLLESLPENIQEQIREGW